MVVTIFLIIVVSLLEGTSTGSRFSNLHLIRTGGSRQETQYPPIRSMRNQGGSNKAIHRMLNRLPLKNIKSHMHGGKSIMRREIANQLTHSAPPLIGNTVVASITNTPTTEYDTDIYQRSGIPQLSARLPIQNGQQFSNMAVSQQSSSNFHPGVFSLNGMPSFSVVKKDSTNSAVQPMTNALGQPQMFLLMVNPAGRASLTKLVSNPHVKTPANVIPQANGSSRETKKMIVPAFTRPASYVESAITPRHFIMPWQTTRFANAFTSPHHDLKSSKVNKNLSAKVTKQSEPQEVQTDQTGTAKKDTSNNMDTKKDVIEKLSRSALNKTANAVDLLATGTKQIEMAISSIQNNVVAFKGSVRDMKQAVLTRQKDDSAELTSIIADEDEEPHEKKRSKVGKKPKKENFENFLSAYTKTLISKKSLEDKLVNYFTSYVCGEDC